MYKAALALLVGLMLSVSGSAWGGSIKEFIQDLEWKLAQPSKLPPCPSNPSKYWDECFADHKFENGDHYFGEVFED